MGAVPLLYYLEVDEAHRSLRPAESHSDSALYG